MLSKRSLRNASKCRFHNCDICGDLTGKSIVTCVEEVADTALQLLERTETAEQILKDILSSRSIKTCEGEILKWLEQV